MELQELIYQDNSSKIFMNSQPLMVAIFKGEKLKYLVLQII